MLGVGLMITRKKLFGGKALKILVYAKKKARPPISKGPVTISNKVVFQEFYSVTLSYYMSNRSSCYLFLSVLCTQKFCIN